MFLIALAVAAEPATETLGCDAPEWARLSRADRAWRDAEAERRGARADLEWRTLRDDAEACLAAPRGADRRACAKRVATFADATEALTASLSTPDDGAACDGVFGADPDAFRPVPVRGLAYARFLHEELEKPSPRSDLATVRAEFAAREHAARLASITRIEGLLAEVDGWEQRPFLLLRLAELAYDEAAWQDLAGARPEATRWMEKSVKILGVLAHAYPEGWEQAEVLFLRGLTRIALGDPAEAHTALARLVTVAPESPYVPEAGVLLADYEGVDGSAFEALVALQRQGPGRAGAPYAYALYRQGLAWQGAGDSAHARRTLKLAIAAAQTVGNAEIEAAATAALALP